MYIRKYASLEEKREEERLSIPENYGGSAFRTAEEAKDIYEEPTVGGREEADEEPAATEEGAIPTKGTELLPVLLSALLSDQREHEDLAALLLFLMLL